ncbi:ribosomal protein S6 [Rhizoctonia solani]|uniref:Ribosomal protein S6 n=1 Tax=Rhizoctonia solani TaxID=456999 RepID=A0A8H8NZT8_9AGAM|nr:ribosomal protein S6 [Rhizoctonia solani]QRW21705.1 ribosomal protein S6 [Rhizoctonia solani]
MASQKHIKELVTVTAQHVMNHGGVVRKITSMGTRVLPQRMRSHQQWHTTGDYWTMHFDASPKVMQALGARMRQDPRVIRVNALKLGEKLEDIVKPREKTISYGSLI